MISETLRRFWRSRIKRPVPSNKAPEPSLPLGLSREHLEQIQALTETTHYKHYLGALEALYEQNVAAVLRPLSHDAYLFQCGVCFAIESIAALPGDLNLKARELDGRHATSSSPDPAAIFANTPFWDAYQRRRAHQYGSAGVPLPGQ